MAETVENLFYFGILWIPQIRVVLWEQSLGWGILIILIETTWLGSEGT